MQQHKPKKADKTKKRKKQNFHFSNYMSKDVKTTDILNLPANSKQLKKNTKIYYLKTGRTLNF
jgi:hypothetical protein